MAVATVAMMIALPAAAHPGPERHPTEEELDDMVYEISSAIDGVDQRLGERIGDFEAQVSEPDQQGITGIIEREVDEAVAGLAQSSE
ncbi:MAG: hypothetical protein OXC19_21455 [Bryobacterales bacterium]|nr:hypothetical protein [Bryobacterales bacterium]